MGSLKKFADDRSSANGKVDSWLTILDEAGFTLEDLERLDVVKAREMLTLVRPHEPAGEATPPMPKGMSDEQQLARWVWIYRYKFGIALDPAAIKIPERPKGMARQILVAADLAKIVSVCESLFGIWFWDKEKVLEATSIRTCENGPYVVWVRDCREADECNRDKRSDSFAQKDCITLQERLLFEIVYFLETGQHLDVQYVTLCCGSRFLGGYVPLVCWNSDSQTVRVYWSFASVLHPLYAVRSAVSLEPSTSNPSPVS